MYLFGTLFLKLIPLYIFIGLGYIAGRFLHVKKEIIAPLLMYIILPVVIFNGVVTTTLSWQYLSLPLFFFLAGSSMCLIFLFVATYIWRDATKNLLAFTAGTGNSGYFGLPVAIAILGQSFLGAAVFAALGLTLYENTVGFFVIARGKSSLRESWLRVIKLPAIYAFLGGLLINIAGLPLAKVELFTTAVQNFSGTYTLLGMMIIGLGIADVRRGAIDFRFISMALLVKCIAWPSLIAVVILLDRQFFHFYNQDIYHLLILMSLIPLAANTVNYATLLQTHPEKAAIAVLISTTIALFYIPLIISFFHFG